jgi:predicted metal-binding membrane protein
MTDQSSASRSHAADVTRSGAIVGTATPSEWRRRDNMLTAALLLSVTVWAWFHTLRGSAASEMTMDGGSHAAMMLNGASTAGSAVHAAGALLFLFGWLVMMAAMMLPALLPLVLLQRRVSRRRHGGVSAGAGTALLLAGYLAVWALAGIPVYGYSLLISSAGRSAELLPALLLVGGGAYHFTALKRSCHARCSSPLAFLAREWRPGIGGAMRLGWLHGVDCLGCCAGLMAGLVALGMMNVAWMLTATVIIFAEKTLALGHRLARPLGTAMAAGGIVLLGRVIAVLVTR